MKKVKYFLLVLLVFLSINVKAEDKCEKEELTRLKELAKKVEFDYDYTVVDGTATFSIKAVNLSNELKVIIIEDYYSGKYKEFKDNTTHTATLSGFKSGERVPITIKGFVPNWCSGETVLTKSIKLPYYNSFYDEEVCNGNEDFKYCKQLIDSNISRKTFDNQFDLYLSEKYASKEEVVPPNNTWKLLIIIGSIVLVLAILVGITILIIRRRKKNRL